MANYLPVMLKPATMNCLTSLDTDIIDSWQELRKKFIDNYKATCEQPSTKHDLARVYQNPGELLRSFIQRFSEVRNRVPNILESKVITTFINDLYHHDELCRKFNKKPPLSISDMFATAK